MQESLGTVLNQAIGIAQEASQRPDHLNDPRFAIYMSRAIAVMAFFSKGFDKTRIDNEARPFFVRCLELAAEALRVLPEDQTVRGKVRGCYASSVVVCCHCMPSDRDVLLQQPLTSRSYRVFFCSIA